MWCDRYLKSREYRAELQKALVEAVQANKQNDIRMVAEEIMHFDRWSYAHQARCAQCNVAGLALHGVLVG